MRALLAQLVRFGLVGAVGLVIDVGVFNLLRITVLAPESVQHGPIYAKLISTSLAIVVNWLGNRYWTFGHARRPRLLREGFEFAVVSVGGMGIGLFCLWVSHYALGFTSLLADNLSSNVVGLALGTAFRFWLYRVWVFRGEPATVHPTQSDPQQSGPAQSDPQSGPTEGPVLPSGRAPLDRIKTVAAVEDRFLRNE